MIKKKTLVMKAGLDVPDEEADEPEESAEPKKLPEINVSLDAEDNLD